MDFTKELSNRMQVDESIAYYLTVFIASFIAGLFSYCSFKILEKSLSDYEEEIESDDESESDPDYEPEPEEASEDEDSEQTNTLNTSLKNIKNDILEIKRLCSEMNLNFGPDVFEKIITAGLSFLENTDSAKQKKDSAQQTTGDSEDDLEGYSDDLEEYHETDDDIDILPDPDNTETLKESSESTSKGTYCRYCKTWTFA